MKSLSILVEMSKSCFFPVSLFQQSNNNTSNVFSSLTLSEIQAWSESFERLMASLGESIISEHLNTCPPSLNTWAFFIAKQTDDPHTGSSWYMRCLKNGDFITRCIQQRKSWGTIFSGGRRVFREFLRCEYSEENILFWMACEDLKKETSPEKVEEKARMIYEDYVSILSPREVSRRLTKIITTTWNGRRELGSTLWKWQVVRNFKSSFQCPCKNNYHKHLSVDAIEQTMFE